MSDPRKKYPVLFNAAPWLFATVVSRNGSDSRLINISKTAVVYCDGNVVEKMVMLDMDTSDVTLVGPDGKRFQRNDSSGQEVVLEPGTLMCYSETLEALFLRLLNTSLNFPQPLMSYMNADGTISILMDRYPHARCSAGQESSYLIQVLFAIDHLHTAHGISHNDLKIENILCSPTEHRRLRYVLGGEAWEIDSADIHVRVIDLGLAVKWTPPQMVDQLIVGDEYEDDAEVPNHFCPGYDLLVFLACFLREYYYDYHPAKGQRYDPALAVILQYVFEGRAQWVFYQRNEKYLCRPRVHDGVFLEPPLLGKTARGALDCLRAAGFITVSPVDSPANNGADGTTLLVCTTP